MARARSTGIVVTKTLMVFFILCVVVSPEAASAADDARASAAEDARAGATEDARENAAGAAALPLWDPAREFRTLDDLYRDFDPEAEPLEIETLKAWDEDGMHLEKLMFTGETWMGEKVRVFAYRGAPAGEGERVPGILHIHGGGQTASLDWVKFWAGRGYTAVSHDFCGDWRRLAPTRTEFTHYGKLVAGMDSPAPHHFEPTPAYNAWVHWTMLARRALTLLVDHPRTDPERIGIHGISVGGTLTWMVAGTDKRVKACAPIYGGGWNSYTTPTMTAQDPVDTTTQARRTFVEAEAYAPRVECPIFFINAANDHHGVLDRVAQSLAIAPGEPKYWTLTPNFIHHIEAEEGRGLPLWMDWQLRGGAPWPESPRLVLAGVGDEAPQLSVKPDRAGEVEQVRIFYALNNPWAPSRHWRTAKVAAAPDASARGVWSAEAPYFDAADVIYAYANVSYKDGPTLSSDLVKQPVAELAGTTPTLTRAALIDPITGATVIDTMDTSENWYWGAAYTDPNISDRLLEPWQGPNGERGFTSAGWSKGQGPSGFDFNTHLLGDPQYQGHGAGALLIDVPADCVPVELKVHAIERHWQPTQKEFIAEVDSAAAKDSEVAGWKTLRLEPAMFKAADGAVLTQWDEVNGLMLKGQSAPGKPPVFKWLRWEK